MSHYKNIDPDQLITRDFLAKDRTELANERTLLAYARTAIMVFATGVTLVKIFVVDEVLVVLGYLMFPLSLLVIIMGIARFFKVKKELSAFYKNIKK